MDDGQFHGKCYGREIVNIRLVPIYKANLLCIKIRLAAWLWQLCADPLLELIALARPPSRIFMGMDEKGKGVRGEQKGRSEREPKGRERR